MSNVKELFSQQVIISSKQYTVMLLANWLVSWFTVMLSLI